MLNMMKLVKLSEYFDIYSGIEKSKVSYSEVKLNQDYIPYIRPSNEYNSTFNGFVDRLSCNKSKIYPKETIFYGNTGAGCHTFAYVSQNEFVPNNNVSVLIAKVNLLLEEKLFYANCITSNRYRFSYGRIPNLNRITNLLIPSKDSIPDFIYQQKIRKISNNALSDNKIELNKEIWKKFKLDILFNISGTTTTKLKLLEESGKGEYPYITTKAKENGCDGFYNYKTESGNVITIDSAVIGYVSYQFKDFSASDHVEKLTLIYPLNKYIAMFLTTILNMEQYRFHYGRKASQDRLKNLNIKLPVTKHGQPDWEFMENYIKSLPYSASL